MPALRILVVDPYYPAFLAAHYREQPGLEEASYEEQLDALMARRFGTSDAYSHNLERLGHRAAEVVPNCVPLQTAWAAEHRRARLPRKAAALARGPGAQTFTRLALQSVLKAQVESFSPDVVYFQNLSFPTDALLSRLRAQRRLIVGQIASPAPPDDRLRRFDLLITSFPHFVDRFRALGVDAEYLPLAFDERLAEMGRADEERNYPVVFVGGVDPRVHAAGTVLLERVAEAADLRVWGYGADSLGPDSPLRSRFEGEAWGLDMYAVLSQAAIVVNRHIDVAEGLANNMRLFEATGCGALLITEAAPNLRDLFEPGKEVVTYAGRDELVEAVRHYSHEQGERLAIARAGRERTLRDHSYARRIEQLAEMLEARVSRRA
jgi:spore maturation protein CgeB